MSDNLPALPDAALPSLAKAFEGQREALRLALKDGDKTAPMVVTQARRALDLTGVEFSKHVSDPSVHKAGLWLLEMVKAGASVLDRGASAQIIWREVPKAPARKIAGRTLFYGAAGLFAVAGFVQGSALTIGAAAVLAALRFFDPKDWKQLWRKIPFMPRRKVNVIEGPDGRQHLADAQVSVDSAGFVDGLADALRTADHILARLAQPVDAQHISDNSQLMGLVQGLLEAQSAGDGAFALRLVETELASFLRSEGIEAVDYSRKTKRLFDVLPGLELEQGGKDKMAAPALTVGDQIIKRGSVWSGSE